MRHKNSKVSLENPGHLKLCLLSEGINFDSSRVFNIDNFAENQFPYGYSNQYIETISRIPTELILPQEVVVGLHFYKNSSWSLAANKKTKIIYLTYQNKKVCPIKFNPKPNFYGKKLSNNYNAEKVGVMYGLYVLSLFTRGWCFYFLKNVPCQFCSLAPTRNEMGKNNLFVLSPSIAKEFVNLALELDGKRILYINYCSGSHKNNDLGVALQIQILKAVKKISALNIQHHLLTMPPNNPQLINEAKKAGLNTLNFAIEVFNPKLFKKICPGKYKYYGYDNLLNMFNKAVEIMGSGKMYANFVVGLEPLDSMFRGFEYFSSKGIAPSVNVFHPDPKSFLANEYPPSIDYLMEMGRFLTSIYQHNKFTPIFPKGGTRNSLDTEISKGYLK